MGKKVDRIPVIPPKLETPRPAQVETGMQNPTPFMVVQLTVGIILPTSSSGRLVNAHHVVVVQRLANLPKDGRGQVVLLPNARIQHHISGFGVQQGQMIRDNLRPGRVAPTKVLVGRRHLLLLLLVKREVILIDGPWVPVPVRFGSTRFGNERQVIFCLDILKIAIGKIGL